ncbi:MAG: hypothetical protein UY15_C0039G0012 [Parcubacteria group bacterium GW2011_GWA2_47_9]|nr:MAG: hypothetical protein UY15_C0039G0012 [Parcubacteria group bacterium GW2011_GWA2_47_9]
MCFHFLHMAFIKSSSSLVKADSLGCSINDIRIAPPLFSVVSDSLVSITSIIFPSSPAPYFMHASTRFKNLIQLLGWVAGNSPLGCSISLMRNSRGRSKMRASVFSSEIVKSRSPFSIDTSVGLDKFSLFARSSWDILESFRNFVRRFIIVLVV